MARPRQIQDEDLLAAARKLFVRDGIGASTRAIASEAGVSEGVLFQRFPTKPELFFAAMIPPAPDVDALLECTSRVEDPCVRLEEIALAMLNYFRELMPVLLPLVTHPSFEPDGFIARHTDSPSPSLEDGLKSHLEREHEQGRLEVEDAEAAAELLVAALHTRALHERLESRDVQSSNDLARAMARALWSGLAPTGTPGKGEAK